MKFVLQRKPFAPLENKFIPTVFESASRRQGSNNRSLHQVNEDCENRSQQWIKGLGPRLRGDDVFKDEGYTLVEVMIAITLGSFLLMALSEFLMMCWKHYLETIKRIHHTEEIQFAFEFLHDKIEHAGFWGCQSTRQHKPFFESTYVPITAYDVSVLKTEEIRALKQHTSRPILTEFPVLGLKQGSKDSVPLFESMLSTRSPVRVDGPFLAEPHTLFVIQDCEASEVFSVQNSTHEAVFHDIIKISHAPLQVAFKSDATLARYEERYFFLSPAPQDSTQLELCEKQIHHPIHCFAQGLAGWQLRFLAHHEWQEVAAVQEWDEVEAVEVALRLPEKQYTTAFPILNRLSW